MTDAYLVPGSERYHLRRGCRFLAGSPRISVVDEGDVPDARRCCTEYQYAHVPALEDAQPASGPGRRRS